MAPASPFDVAQLKKAESEASIELAGSDTQQPVGNVLIFIGQHGLVAIAAFADLEYPVSLADRNGVVSNGLARHLPAGRWRHHFVAMAPMISALRRASAYRSLRRP